MSWDYDTGVRAIGGDLAAFAWVCPYIGSTCLSTSTGFSNWEVRMWANEQVTAGKTGDVEVQPLSCCPKMALIYCLTPSQMQTLFSCPSAYPWLLVQALYVRGCRWPLATTEQPNCRLVAPCPAAGFLSKLWGTTD